jgi:D-alanyl-lipoteichoic acid acyltransferase DltB (MBOAT superfamily)
VVFSSYIFVFAFLPITLIGFFLCSKASPTAAKVWLCATSIVFYGYWYVGWIPILLLSVAFNYLVGNAIRATLPGPSRTAVLLVGVAANLSALFYYKYLYAVLGFFQVTAVSGLSVDPIALPLGISFFTFTQIAYLVDTSQGSATEYSFLNYLLFVTFFPHLIAGPIVHHRELMPQFEQPRNYRLQFDEVAIGLTIFVIGLAKKTVIADRMGYFAGELLDEGGASTPAAAWLGMLAYSMQLYFDFSGYSDMAIGLARIFGIKFPLNFNSPYKATNIIDFWQRWHITLTRFLTAYVYNVLALWLVRRRAAAGKAVSKKTSQSVSGFLEMIALPTAVTMLLAGIWHGAGLQFVVFGMLHGAYITINHAWRTFGPARRRKTARRGAAAIGTAVSSIALTYLAVLVAQVFFRAESLDAAIGVVAAMVGFGGADLAGGALAASVGNLSYAKPALYVAVAMLIAWAAPNTQQIMAAFEPALDVPRTLPIARIRWRMSMAWAVATGFAFFFGALNITEDQPFIYFQF